MFLLACAVIAVIVASGGYFVTVVCFAAIYALFVSGLNLFMGYTGQVSFGQNAFAALGGYSTAVLTTRLNLDPLAALLLGALLSGAIAFVVGFPTLRLRGHYLAMATLALGLIAYEVAVQWTGLTQGYMGISGIPGLGFAGVEIDDERLQAVVLLAIAGLGMGAALRLRHSRFGRALAAVAGDEEAARAVGINITHYKLAAFVLAAVYASVAGSLMAQYVGFVSPEVFGLAMVVLGFTMLYIGGIGNVGGPLVGALIVEALPQTVSGLKDYQDLVYGAALILILIYAPKGLAAINPGLPLAVQKNAS
ncbi:MAG TPA: branched-chain amino acid ABC transporter permease [Alphaproteobacteria bacterium]